MQANIHTIAIAALLAILISFPAIAAEPQHEQNLIGGPIPLSSVGSETFSCSVLNQAPSKPLNATMNICGINSSGFVNCTESIIEVSTASSYEVDSSDDAYTDSGMMFCTVTYDGQAVDLGGTVCLSDSVDRSQTCIQLQAGQYQGAMNYLASIPQS